MQELQKASTDVRDNNEREHRIAVGIVTLSTIERRDRMDDEEGRKEEGEGISFESP